MYFIGTILISSEEGETDGMLSYCKTLIIRMTLFLWDQTRLIVSEALFSHFVIPYSMYILLEIIGKDFIFASTLSREITRT